MKDLLRKYLVYTNMCDFGWEIMGHRKRIRGNTLSYIVKLEYDNGSRKEVSVNIDDLLGYMATAL